MKKYFLFICFCFLVSSATFAQEGQIRLTKNPMIDELVSLKTKMTKNNAFGQRYKIQVFYGNNAEATKVLKEFKEKHPNWPALITYQAPNYKVWVGDFRNRLEADRAFLKVKKDYSSAFIFKPKN